MATAPARSRQSERSPRSWRARSGAGRTFGSLFLAAGMLFLWLGCKLLYDALADPLTAEPAQIVTGSVCLTFCLLLLAFLIHERR